MVELLDALVAALAVPRPGRSENFAVRADQVALVLLVQVQQGQRRVRVQVARVPVDHQQEQENGEGDLRPEEDAGDVVDVLDRADQRHQHPSSEENDEKGHRHVIRLGRPERRLDAALGEDPRLLEHGDQVVVVLLHRDVPGRLALFVLHGPVRSFQEQVFDYSRVPCYGRQVQRAVPVVVLLVDLLP